VGYLAALLGAHGVEATPLARDADRPNLLARILGRGEAPPLLLTGHVDVVTTAGQGWRHPPFGAEEHDGFVWGRGALDMKGGVAMLVAAFLRRHVEGPPPPGDVMLCLVVDEEAGGDAGARFLVEAHAERFAGVRYAIGEFGGFTVHLGGRRFTPIQVAEKQPCRLAVTFRGAGGHGALARAGSESAAARLARAVLRLERSRLPVHVTDPARRMIGAVADALPVPSRLALRALLVPALTDRALDLLGPRGAAFDPLLHHTATPTVLAAGAMESINVVPSEATLWLDGRVLPGFGAEDLVRELHPVLGASADVEVLRFDPGPPAPDMGLFGCLTAVLSEMHPETTPVPLLLAASTDARHFARLGIQTYGFLPMPLPPDFDFSATIHAADERVPVGAVEFGAEALDRLLGRFGAESP